MTTPEHTAPAEPDRSPTPLASGRRVLVIEDEPDMAALVRLHLGELAGLVRCEHNGPDGLRAARDDGPWDLVVLDLRLPGLGGLDVCRALREAGSRVALLMLTARATEIDRVLGLELGADDYLTKPFSVLELRARVRALWRRIDERAAPADRAAAGRPAELRCGALHMDQRRHRAWLGAQELSLTAREFELLWFFAAAPGQVFSRAELLREVWSYGHDGYDHTVNTHINRLRNKVGDGWIHTVWGVGYRFEAPA